MRKTKSPKNDLRHKVAAAIAACLEKKAENISVLEMGSTTSAFTDYFVIASGSNPRQIQAISDQVEERLAKVGLHATHVEGYNLAEWVLLDYVDFVVHIFSEKARNYYDLERLWKSATRLHPAELTQPRKAARQGAAARPGKRAKS